MDALLIPFLITGVVVGSLFILSISAAIVIYAVKSRPAPDWVAMCLGAEEQRDRLYRLLERLLDRTQAPTIDDPRIDWEHPMERVGAPS
jgi:hypothetical protein